MTGPTRVLAGALGLVLGAGLLAFWLQPYGVYLLSLWAVYTISAIGLNLTLGYAGQVSLAQASFVGIGAYTTALLMPHGAPFGVTLLIGATLCFGLGVLLGFPRFGCRATTLPSSPLRSPPSPSWCSATKPG